MQDKDEDSVVMSVEEDEEDQSILVRDVDEVEDVEMMRTENSKCAGGIGIERILDRKKPGRKAYDRSDTKCWQVSKKRVYPKKTLADKKERKKLQNVVAARRYRWVLGTAAVCRIRPSLPCHVSNFFQRPQEGRDGGLGGCRADSPGQERGPKGQTVRDAGRVRHHQQAPAGPGLYQSCQDKVIVEMTRYPVDPTARSKHN